MTQSILANNSGSAFINAIFLTSPYKVEFNDTNYAKFYTFLNSILETLQLQFVPNNIIIQNLTLLKLRNDPINADMNLIFEIQTEMSVITFTNIINNTIIKFFGSNITITNITIIQFPNFDGSTQSTQSSLTNTIANSLNTADTFTTLQTLVNKDTTATINSEINTSTNIYLSTTPSSINSTLLPTTTAGSTQSTQSSLTNTIANSLNTADTFTTLQTLVNKDTTATITSEINTSTNIYLSTTPSSINSTLLPTTTADSLTTLTKKPDDYVYDVIMNCSFHNDTFDPNYNNKTSTNYIIYTNQITMKMRESLRNIALRLLYTIFHSLSKGSVIVNVEMSLASRTEISNNELITSVRSAAVNAYANSITIISIIDKPRETTTYKSNGTIPPYGIGLIVAASVIFIIAAIIIIMEIPKLCSSKISKFKNDSDSKNFEMENDSMNQRWMNYTNLD